MHPRTLLLLFVSVLACKDEDDALEPSAGAWSYVASAVVTSTCGDEFPEALDGGFTIAGVQPGRFVLDDAQHTSLEFECTVDGDSFECAEEVKETTDPMTMSNGTYTLSFTGALASETEMVGNYHVTFACEGPICDDFKAGRGIPELPCDYTVTFTARAK